MAAWPSDEVLCGEGWGGGGGGMPLTLLQTCSNVCSLAVFEAVYVCGSHCVIVSLQNINTAHTTSRFILTDYWLFIIAIASYVSS